MKTQTQDQTELRSSIRAEERATQPFRIVLHKACSGDWVTHIENLTENIGPGGYRSKNAPDYYWGHYFGDDYAAAVEEYKARCAKYALLPNIETFTTATQEAT